MRVDSLNADPWLDSEEDNLYRVDDNDPVNKVDPSGMSPIPVGAATQPSAAPTYGGTLDNMTPGAAALYQALLASPNGRLTNAQAFSIPLTDLDARLYLAAMGRGSMIATPGAIKDDAEIGFWDSIFRSGSFYPYDSYDRALKKNPALGMNRDQYYDSLAAAHNITRARQVMQMNGNKMAYLYSRLAMPTATLIAMAVPAPAMIPRGALFYTPGYGASPALAGLVVNTTAGTRLVGFTASEMGMLRQSLADLAAAGYNTSPIQQLVKAQMPAGYRAMSLSSSPTGAALSSEAFSSQGMLNHVIEEELLHLNQNLPGQTFAPGTAAANEEAVNAVRKFAEPKKYAELSQQLNLLECLDAGHVEALKCPKCGRATVSVWFTHPDQNTYRTWFICSECDFWSRAQNSGRPRFFSEARVRPDLEACDVSTLERLRFKANT